jgi:hypothetical protein
VVFAKDLPKPLDFCYKKIKIVDDAWDKKGKFELSCHE